ncbi:MAG: DUF1491 family protein [Janthinobacterium lividum]
MTTRLPTAIGVGALLRRVNDSGGMAMVRAKGDPQAGGVLFLLEEGAVLRAMERGVGPCGTSALVEVGRVESRLGSPPESLDDYWRRRRARDPDLWVIELNVPAAERFIVETMPFD